MTSSAPLNFLTGALVPSSGIVLSFDAANYTKWAIYMCATLARAGLLAHIDDTIAANPSDSEWTVADYTVLNVLHSAIDEEIADMVLARGSDGTPALARRPRALHREQG
jgi:hypothetical protein